MTALSTASSSTHFCTTCSFNAAYKIGLTSYRDYLQVSLYAYNLLLFSLAEHIYAVIDFINIPGYSYSKCSIPLYSDNRHHLLIYELSNIRKELLLCVIKLIFIMQYRMKMIPDIMLIFITNSDAMLHLHQQSGG